MTKTEVNGSPPGSTVQTFGRVRGTPPDDTSGTMLAASLRLKSGGNKMCGKAPGRVRRAYCFGGAHVP